MTVSVRDLQQARQRHIQQLLDPGSNRNAASEDRERQLRSNLVSIERELESIREEAELRDDPVARIARGKGRAAARKEVILDESRSS